MLTIKPLDAPFGAEVEGIDLSQPLDADEIVRLDLAYNNHSVLVFRNQTITGEQHVQFSRRFGALEVHVLKQYTLPAHPEILVLSNIVENGAPVGIRDAGKYWHTDLSYTATPSRGSILRAVEVPRESGVSLGDTLFVSTAAAYDTLPENTKKKLGGRKATHRFWDRYQQERAAIGQPVEVSEEQRRKTPDVVHPIVRTHPVTGRKCIYVNEGFTVGVIGMPEDESTEMLVELHTHITRPEFVYRHKWQVGDVLMWENCATQHKATVDFALPQRRLMHRTTLTGTAPF